jgi:hypothetical protein
MDLEGKLNNRREDLLQRISDAASKRDVRTVIRLNEALERIDRLDAQMQEIKQKLEVLENEARDPAPRSAPASPEISNNSSARRLGRARGAKARQEFVDQVSGGSSSRDRIRGVIWNSLKGKVGIAYALELKPDRWFLGLPENGYKHAVLLCEDMSNRMTHFSLPHDFLDELRPALSRSNGQLKFNVLKRDRQYFLSGKNLERFRDNFYGLK